MKKIIAGIGLTIAVLTGTSAYVLRYSSGIAGYTASPGELSCNSCHGGGAVAASSALTISAAPAFDNNEYTPGAVYDVSVHVSAEGYSKYGFACEILNNAHVSTGTMQVTGADVQLLNAGSRKNVTHTGPKAGSNGATFSFQWLAPDSGEGAVTFYVAGNSVNGDHSTGGDYPVPPVTLTLGEGAAITPTPVATAMHKNALGFVSGLSVYPNPAVDGLTNLSFFLGKPQAVIAELLDLNGKPVKLLLSEKDLQGFQQHVLNLRGITPGIYFIKTSVNGQRAAQKLIVVG